MPIPTIRCGGRFVMSSPSKSTLPCRARIKPEIVRRVVDFPAPLLPTSVMILPFSTCSEIRCKATIEPYATSSSSTCSIKHLLLVSVCSPYSRHSFGAQDIRLRSIIPYPLAPHPNKLRSPLDRAESLREFPQRSLRRDRGRKFFCICPSPHACRAQREAPKYQRFPARILSIASNCFSPSESSPQRVRPIKAIPVLSPEPGQSQASADRRMEDFCTLHPCADPDRKFSAARPSGFLSHVPLLKMPFHE